MSTRSLNVLWLEDDLFRWQHLFDQLKQVGHKVTFVTSLWDAYLALEASFSGHSRMFDVVLIDLFVPLGNKGEHLLPTALRDLNVLDVRSDVLGRALGVWLWTQAGKHVDAARPWHAYLTVIPDLFDSDMPSWDPEFKDASGQRHHRELLLSKWGSEVNNLSDTVDRISGIWESHLKARPRGEFGEGR